VRTPLRCNVTRFVERQCRIGAHLLLGFGETKLGDAIAKERPILRATRVDDLAQGANRVVAPNDIGKGGLTTNMLKVLSDIVNLGHQITGRNDILIKNSKQQATRE
jgi:hypothetical protein